MPLVNMTDMLQHAYRHNYAVGAFGVASWDILEGVVQAAENLRAPIILSLSKTYPGIDNIEALAMAVVGVAQRATIPVAFQVEVADDPQAVAEAVKMGCGGVVFDASQHALMDNIAFTKKAVGLARPHGVMVVGQLANLENGEGPELSTKESSTKESTTKESLAGKSTSPTEAKCYVERTGVACLAVSVSRMERGSTKHDFARLAKINQTLGIPLGIHGGSGLSDDQFRRMINFGAAKINYSTPLFDVVAQRIRQCARTPSAGYAGYVEQVRDAIRSEVERCIRLWGCSGRAAEVLQQSRAWPPGAMDAEHSDTEAIQDAQRTNTARAPTSSVRRIK